MRAVRLTVFFLFFWLFWCLVKISAVFFYKIYEKCIIQEIVKIKKWLKNITPLKNVQGFFLAPPPNFKYLSKF